MDDKVMAGAFVIVNSWLALQPGEKILLIHDDAYLTEAEALKAQAEVLPARVKLVRFEEFKDNLSALNGLFDGVDVAVGLTDYSLLTTTTVSEAVANGMRYLS